MALTPKERERIIEEERVRFETKQALWAEHCAKHPRRGRWLFWVAALVLALALWHHHRACYYGGYGHMGMGPGAHCMHPGWDGAQPQEPGAQPAPKQP
jgi:hypothetical protein